ncbi:hypothetical protein ASE27_14520 [Oerskovia sp. Root918]|uniref:aminoacyl-tRNA deacylase n=1 Tax=Oerskovia sp. Root918 TaxID=1736607 RepID=UPI0006F41DC4|nr:YbaK/EbsC family protein [Oerskovia sp. Root918]KRD35925.1 hypothetical protein ASE27_14520 [Oerskovia sp. Root918]
MSEERARAALEASGIDFTITRHGPVGSLEEAAEARGIDPANIVKTLVVRRGDDDYLFVLVPGDRTISWPKLRSLLGVSRLSMPDKDVAREVTGYERGTITPFGSTTAWPVVADSRVVFREVGDVVGQDEGGADLLGEPDGASPLVSIGGGAFGVAATVDGARLAAVLGAQVADVTDPV